MQVKHAGGNFVKKMETLVAGENLMDNGENSLEICKNYTALLANLSLINHLISCKSGNLSLDKQ